MISVRKTRGIGEFASYQSSPSSGVSPQPSPSPLGGSNPLRQPSQFQQLPASKRSPRGWAPVTPPATSPTPYQQPLCSFSSSSAHQQQHSQDNYERAPQRPQSNHSGAPSFEAPPSTIILRPEPPISQVPAPVYQAQPAATKAPVSGNMRGDLKWPPPSVKAQTEAENRARLELAKGPAFRPRRVHKDYSGFFAQHALTHSYPGYRAPPGTQYFTPTYQH